MGNRLLLMVIQQAGTAGALWIKINAFFGFSRSKVPLIIWYNQFSHLKSRNRKYRKSAKYLLRSFRFGSICSEQIFRGGVKNAERVLQNMQ